jgi:multiple sugar transport system permease protein
MTSASRSTAPRSGSEQCRLQPSGRVGLRPSEVARRALIYTLLVCGSFVFVLPLLWMITTSLKPQSEVFTFPPTFFPRTFRWQNYPEAWHYPNMAFPRWALNTVFITALVVLGILVTSSLCAYGFARIRYPGRDFWFMAVLASIMLPSQVTLIPLYIVFHRLHWLDTFKPLIIPAWLGGGAFYIFILRQFFLQIPAELEDAAMIDGCSRIGIWWRIFLPLSKPALASVAIFSFQGEWNDFYWPLICLTSIEKFTLALGINMFRSNFPYDVTPVHLMMAMAFLMAIPVIVVFFVAQRYFIQGVILSGLKG